jgi:hypothetical protein
MRLGWLAVLLLGACAGGPAREELPAPPLPERVGVDPFVAARAEGVEFRAVGDGFVLDIMRTEHIRLRRGEDELAFPKPDVRYPRWNGAIYETAASGHSLVIRIRDDRPCVRADSGLYPTTVDLVLDGAQLSACGRRF